MRLDGRQYTVLGLRPGTTERFATNRFHHTWHLLSDRPGAQLLARLLWGLSYERHPDTLLLVDRPFLDPTPFEGEPSDPFVLVPSKLTPLGEAAARALRRSLPQRTPSEGTVRWHTPGLDLALADTKAWYDAQRDRHLDGRSLITRRGGLLMFAAPPAELRNWAVATAGLTAHHRADTDYVYLDHNPVNGEVQIFRRYRAMVSSAVTARQEILATDDGLDTDQSVRERIWHRSAEVRRRRARRVVNVPDVPNVPDVDAGAAQRSAR